MVARHSAFYSPVIGAIAAGFLGEERLEATYDVLRTGQRSHVLIRDGVVDIMQSAVSSNWKPMDEGESPLPVHFAQINRRDGFFLAGRAPDPSFHWRKLEGKTLLADHGLQPLVMLKYAAHCQGVDWSKIRVVDAGSVEQMDAAFRAGQGDYVHQQGPAPQELQKAGMGFIVASVGEAMPLVAFSSLCASHDFLETETAQRFLSAYRKSRAWVQQTPAAQVMRAQARFFPNADSAALTAAIERYQQLGCWEGDIKISRELYEQALNVFEFSGAIRTRHPFEAVCRCAMV
jgi:NitT/TauT family transport system substrate-binding protein